MSAEQGIRARLDDVLRTTAGDQAKAYQDYAALLDRLAARKIKTVEFARDAVDLYMGALGKAASAGLSLVGETVSAGIKGVGAAAEAFDQGARSVADEASAPPRTSQPAGASGARPGGAASGPTKAPGKP